MGSSYGSSQLHADGVCSIIMKPLSLSGYPAYLALLFEEHFLTEVTCCFTPRQLFVHLPTFGGNVGCHHYLWRTSIKQTMAEMGLRHHMAV